MKRNHSDDDACLSNYVCEKIIFSERPCMHVFLGWKNALNWGI